MKKIAILGSTGSIGKAALEVVRHLKGQFQVVALAAKSNQSLLEAQAKEFNPKQLFLWDSEKAASLKKKLPSLSIYSQEQGLGEIVTNPEMDFILFAMSGSYSLPFFLLALQEKKQVGLANKELLVMGGELIQADPYQILPVDSEHSALFQCLQREDQKVRRCILTASGGPFFQKTLQELRKVSLQEALNHPTWKMGPKVTIDSSTLMNKGLEVIEAHYLFGISPEKIEVVIHPQSWIHSLVEYEDGSILAQMSHPDMKLPIQYALTYPERKPSLIPHWNLNQAKRLDFYPVDKEKFGCLDLAFTALKKKRGSCCYLNACNEVLVEQFLQGKLRWIELSQKLKQLMSLQPHLNVLSLDTILQLDKKARELAFLHC